MQDYELKGKTMIARRFRGYLPVVVDVETGGFDSRQDALLEIAVVILEMNGQGLLVPLATHACHVEPFPDARLDPKALAFNGIDPYHPFRGALPELEALHQVLDPVRQSVKSSGCKRAILVGHNAAFDLGFVNAASHRAGYKRNPFHPFSTFDTVSLAGLALGETVLAQALMAAGFPWDNREAHSAIYDAEKTATLFCWIVNQWRLGRSPGLALRGFDTQQGALVDTGYPDQPPGQTIRAADFPEQAVQPQFSLAIDDGLIEPDHTAHMLPAPAIEEGLRGMDGMALKIPASTGHTDQTEQ